MNKLFLTTALSLCTPLFADGNPTPSVEQLQQQISTLQNEVQALASASQMPASNPHQIHLWGYGELGVTHPISNGRNTQADLARAVFGMGEDFDASTRFNSEFEIEHAVASSVDQGEFEVEQFYVDHDFNRHDRLRTGLFLIPAGFLNEHHEPTHYYGVQRNFVETLIIPSTWREGGVNLQVTNDAGWNFTIGLSTDQDLSAWNFQPQASAVRTALDLENSNIAPLQQTHQELQLAHAQHPATFLAIQYRGIAGLDLGGTVFSGLASNSADPNANQRITLSEIHARTDWKCFEFSSVSAYGHISNTAAVNAVHPNASLPMPAAFEGSYVQAVFIHNLAGLQSMNPFLRIERFNMASRYEGVSWPISTQTAPLLADRVTTLGINYYLTPRVVFKIDTQHFAQHRDYNRINFGMGVEL